MFQGPLNVANRSASSKITNRPFVALTVGDAMTRAGLTRTVFYRHFDKLAQMAPELLPDSEDPLLDQVLPVLPKT